ncbi:hypothetical protein [Mesorhizobium escarrei]|uniref:Uncharacterized protein n=1 Tax=Mesorhizobium escarrei TaxID=666018 RepID=A0ABN8K5U0_9HYPH|nr:hypothetical protein [Mesorhizobium escarrei]CAH2405599.1 conserved hypothetical protein [Mesorhizobium escarrei]
MRLAQEYGAVAWCLPPPFDGTIPRHIQSYLYGPDGFTPLDGASKPVHEHRELHGIAIDTDDRRKAFLRFFCFFVRGADGPFEVQEDPDGFDATAVRPPDAFKEFEEIVGPLRAHEAQDGGAGSFLYDACLLYGHQLFRVRFCIYTHGVIEMLGDELVGENVRRVPQIGFAGTARYSALRPLRKRLAYKQ